MTTLKLIVGSTRPVRVGGQLADGVAATLAEATGATVEVVDLRELDLPFLSEPQLAATGVYTLDTTKNWSEIVSAADGIVWLNPEYNGGMPAPVKNAIDHLFAEWDAKPTMVVGYGFGGGARSARHLSEILGNVKANLVAEPVTMAFGDNAPNEGQVANPQAIVDAHRDELTAAARTLVETIESDEAAA
ncbi:NAD(P)H-dependent oxidoreductase [Tessaracoccus sp. SD287]|uniref:NADPH-dependent FMN reductase n=1 Tax=Tessaracoccus sp. SD287 TaxID=2782008 RepID=UPI001A95D5D4|nr:NAD(P)H-dependent oxidoreductase [Tessaracoccus sp. SD287]MBO1030534.1 NAD(P)H-dependent oxidoreductase [Tessaracoccus sp. SD287]